MDPLVIVGTGLAAYNLAREVRKLDAQMPITLISRDAAAFYSKPMLSNALMGKKTAESLVIKNAQAMAVELQASVLEKSEVTQIDVKQHELLLQDGRRIAYGRLVLALGADPIRLPLQGDATSRVLSVNDLDDFAAYRSALDAMGASVTGEGAKRVLILGAGLIGCEFANDLLSAGYAPVVLDIAERVLGQLLPTEASKLLQSKLEQAGVQFRFGVAATSVDLSVEGGAPGALQVTLDSGETIECGLVVSAIGLRPRTELARVAGLQIKRGIVVNEHLMSSVADIYALGDCAQVHDQVLPYVLPLMQQARALSATLAGKPTPVLYPCMPVSVKTPACPTVVCPPPPNGIGHWQIMQNEEGLQASFFADAEEKTLLGFVLQGKAISQRQAYVARMSPPRS